MSTARPLRIALYSHDAMGVGHVRRNLLIAQSLNKSLQASALLICGVHEAGLFPSGDGIDCLTLPALAKLPDGTYVSRELGLPVDDLIRLRASTLKAALLAYQPDVLIVDKIPCGILNELRDVVEILASQGKTRLVLGLREVLDQPETVREEWRTHDYDASIRAFYDTLWVYGDPAVFDPRSEYDFAPDIAQKVQFTGYFDQRERLRHATLDGRGFLQGLGIPDGQHVLCTVGGGQDGQRLALTFAASEFPRDTHGLLVTGPFMPPDVRLSLMQFSADRPHLHVVDYVSDVDSLMPHVDGVVCMGGYNTIASVVSFQKSALVAPRIHPRQEQMIRARRFESLGLLSVLTPEDLSPASVSAWLHHRPRPARHQVDLGGTRRLTELISSLLGRDSSSIPDTDVMTPLAEAC